MTTTTPAPAPSPAPMSKQVTLVKIGQGDKGKFRAIAEMPWGARIAISPIQGFEDYAGATADAHRFAEAIKAGSATLEAGAGKKGRFRVIADMPYGARINISGPRGFATEDEALANADKFVAAFRDGKVTVLDINV